QTTTDAGSTTRRQPHLRDHHGLIGESWKGRQLNALASGEETAASLGINVGRFQFVLMTITSLLMAVVAVAGGVGFVGLMVTQGCVLEGQHRARAGSFG
ncbi:MAG: iron chelate uptake ABC transporter family permease subunit, partial [Mycobacteriales bacterium]